MSRLACSTPDQIDLLTSISFDNFDIEELPRYSIESFKQVQVPLIHSEEGYIIDKTSRYITEDLPFGTCFIKFIATQLDIKTPNIDKAIKTVQTFIEKELVDTIGNFNKNNWIQSMNFPTEFIEYLEKSIKV